MSYVRKVMLYNKIFIHNPGLSATKFYKLKLLSNLYIIENTLRV